MKTLKVLGLLLAYPSKEQIAALPELQEILTKEAWLPEPALQGLVALMNWMRGEDLLDLQEEYVALFDRTPSLCLHLFEHVHGDSRDRGQALSDLFELYKGVGLEINTEEMPDYLPLFLEYLSFIDAEDARRDLGDTIDVIGVLARRLSNRKSPYAAVFDALIEAAACKPDKKAIEAALKESQGSLATYEELDKVWEEQAAFENSMQTTGQESDGGCPMAEDMLARMNIPVEPFAQNKESSS